MRTKLTQTRRLRTRLTSSAFFIYLGLAPFAAFADCAIDHLHLKGDTVATRFTISVMDTNKTRAKGLMHQATLPMFEGMLFVYDHPQPVHFWMRNTLIPLDMLFISQAGEITKIHENAIPLDETAIFGGDQVFAVLEINGGLAEKLQIETGSVLQHPAFNPALALWSCKK